MKFSLSKELNVYLKYMKDESSFIPSVFPENLTKDKFLSDEPLKKAVVRSLEIIDEATKKIPADF
jgi:uncharacterized protein with HEPN domain